MHNDLISDETKPVMESSSSKMDLLVTLALATAVLRIIGLTWLSIATVRHIRLSACCSTCLSLSIFTFSAVIYAVSWLIHSLGILWETVNDVFALTYSEWTVTETLCGLQTLSLTTCASGLTSVALTELVTRTFTRRWTKQVTKIVAVAIHTTAVSLVAFLTTRLTWPSTYSSLLQTSETEANNVSLSVDLLLCGVDVRHPVALLGPAAIALVSALILLAWTFTERRKDVNDGQEFLVEETAMEADNGCCNSDDSPLGRAGIPISCLAAFWLLSGMLLNVLLHASGPILSGLTLAQHLTLMTATILTATTTTTCRPAVDQDEIPVPDVLSEKELNKV